jgi:hypothetical protein
MMWQGINDCKGRVCVVCEKRKMLNLQHQHNNHTTTPHMMVDPTHWDPPSCEGLLYSCCDNVVYESNPNKYWQKQSRSMTCL